MLAPADNKVPPPTTFYSNNGSWPNGDTDFVTDTTRLVSDINPALPTDVSATVTTFISLSDQQVKRHYTVTLQNWTTVVLLRDGIQRQCLSAYHIQRRGQTYRLRVLRRN